MDAASHALAALCCDSISTARVSNTDHPHQSQTVARAVFALNEKGIEAYHEVALSDCFSYRLARTVYRHRNQPYIW